jgi:hypothetical protein
MNSCNLSLEISVMIYLKASSRSTSDIKTTGSILLEPLSAARQRRVGITFVLINYQTNCRAKVPVLN